MLQANGPILTISHRDISEPRQATSFFKFFFHVSSVFKRVQATLMRYIVEFAVGQPSAIYRRETCRRWAKPAGRCLPVSMMVHSNVLKRGTGRGTHTDTDTHTHGYVYIYIYYNIYVCIIYIYMVLYGYYLPY